VIRAVETPGSTFVKPELPKSMPPVARSVEELFPLIEFCRNGDLKAASEWIKKGNPLDLPPGKKTRRASPLQIAIEKDFLTLTEVLLDGGADPLASNETQDLCGARPREPLRHSSF
jgi:hypothetical protein